jgi:hypothetical protein
MLLYVLFNKFLVFVQNISFAFGGLFMKFFVNRSDMWWPEVMPNVTFFRFVRARI